MKDQHAVAFTGSRKDMTTIQAQRLAEVLADLHMGGVNRIRHGCCKGADRTAHRLAVGLGFRIGGHPGDQEQSAWAHEPTRLGDFDFIKPVQSYLVRNREMVDKCGLLIATPAEMTFVLRSGTWATVRYASDTGTRTIFVFPDGTKEISS
ncbi:MAG: hypothetical protein GTO63_24345 [Anaerolineae bacterium]|nr:hypothetical protein [Anaerolineae bacterium]NIN97854.1 hypothetical protein [Anaerolineae bacterium]